MRKLLLLFIISFVLPCNEGEVELWGECYNIDDTEILNLRWSNLSGEIPPEIGYLTNLQKLFLLGNNLTGEIPQEIGNLINLTYLEFTDNNFIGEIPSSIGNLVNLEEFYAYNNSLSGEIPPSIGNLTNLTTLSLKDNQLSGQIPTSIGNLIDLRYLLLNNNQFEGELPSQIYNLTNLEFLWVHNNLLTGQIDENICNFFGITADEGINFSDNEFCRPYPNCLTQDNIGNQDTSECPPLTIHVPEDFGTIQEAIDYSIDGDSIFVSAGTYYENINFNGKNISLIGEDRETTIIDGGQNGSVVSFLSGETSLSSITNFTLQNGINEYGGGGIIIRESSSTLSNLNIINNSGSNNPTSSSTGGGISIKNIIDNIYIDNLLISNNENHGKGAGVGIDLVSDEGEINPYILEITNTTIQNNTCTTERGGGISINRGEVILRNVNISNNNSQGGGGLIGFTGGIIEIEDSYISNNSCVSMGGLSGGGIYNSGAIININNSTISNNTTLGSGGGIFCVNN